MLPELHQGDVDCSLPCRVSTLLGRGWCSHNGKICWLWFIAYYAVQVVMPV